MKLKIGILLALAIVLVLLFVSPHPIKAQLSVSPPSCTGTWTFPNSCTYTPTQLGVNALTEPGTGTTALSTIIDTRGVKQATLNMNCTQGTITLNVQTYAEDGATTLALIAPVAGAAANANIQLFVGSESSPLDNTVAPTANIIVRFPQRAIAFSITNASASAGTCTGRLFAAY